ncbi:MAG: nucleoside triphosphate pyrophosphohydrolase [Ruminiclostridium sp.]|nr:nucleoside triphosphate pyrophosphohydrolase [Ruminiclostridium sp.]
MYILDFQFKDKYDINDLLEVTRILRSENGCVWDREQDHKSIRMNVLEEAYEVMEAIDADDDAMLKEELGDLLFQAVFHCQIEDERGRFCFDDICDDVAKKMIYRHPHVFGDVKVSNSDDVLKNWDKLKKKSKNQETVADTLDSVPMVLPALMRGQKVCKRAANAGVEITDSDISLEIVKKKLTELELAISDKNEQETEVIFGELLLSCCNLSRIIKKDSEKALTFAINKFIMRFRELERDTVSQGKTLDNLSDEQVKALFLSSD